MAFAKDRTEPAVRDRLADRPDLRGEAPAAKEEKPKPKRKRSKK